MIVTFVRRTSSFRSEQTFVAPVVERYLDQKIRSFRREWALVAVAVGNAFPRGLWPSKSRE